MLNNPMRIEGIRDDATKFELDSAAHAISCHKANVHLHLLLRVSIPTLLVPLILVFTFLGGFGIELIGEVFYCVGDGGRRIGFPELGQSSLEPAEA
jgi:hypothetical protein